MTIALRVQSLRPKKFFSAEKILHFLVAPLYRLWWHVYAYTTITGIMVLSLLSLILLYVYEHLSRVFSQIQRRISLQAK